MSNGSARRSGPQDLIKTFIERYTPEVAAAIRACRRKMRALVPRGAELVYDNYSALVFGYGPSERTSDAVLSIAAYPKWVTLFFLKGARLPDPAGLLQGSGSTVRSIRLSTPADLDRREVRALIAAALRTRASDLKAAMPLQTVVKSVSVKQRPRRPAAAEPRA